MVRIDDAERAQRLEQEKSLAAKEAMERQKSVDQKRKSASFDAGPSKVLGTDKPERIAVRLDLINRNDPNAFERLIGKRDIVSVNFFERGLQTAKSVCRVKTLGMASGPPDYATGFLATAALLVTNNHVLPDGETASRSLAEFGYELDANFVERRGRIFPFAPMEAFYTSVDLDFTIVAISPMGHDGTPITDFGVLPLIPMSGKGITGEHVSIIQHPGGGTKQVVVRENRIIALDEKKFPRINPAFIHYTADTEPGSSGAPVFNDQWDLVAIHHQAIVDRNQKGEPLNKNGKVWTEADGESAKNWIANEGIRISAIWAHLQAAAPFSADAAKIMAMLSYEPHAAYRPRPAQATTTPRKWETIPNAPEATAFETTRFTDPAFADSLGYDPKFLGPDLIVPLPKTGSGFKGTLAKNNTNDKTVFDYTHFSLAMNVERRLAIWTAVNIDGNTLKSTKSPSWRRDERLPANQQTLAEVYGSVPGKGIQIDRGHLVRRLDPVWGPQAVADRAGDDTFHYTNAAPQEHVYNSETWGNLEDFVLARADKNAQKASVMTGPILRPDDNFYGEGLKGGPWQIPWSFWKICIFKRPDGTVSVTGFVVEQSSTISPIFEATRYNPYSVDEARVFQRPIKLIEELTNLDFGALRKMDRMGSVETTAIESSRPIRSADDIAF
ncbi:DNA/RNA non-specific endonuclease [Mesorhizobium sp. Cs1299R1N3]|uniref:DNA/RNA non-specific endonuclease n=1 Tax=Mesorhizobium sp. Cs1299R1N3 TaxID=3015173 RepID=UPI00301DBD2C